MSRPGLAPPIARALAVLAAATVLAVACGGGTADVPEPAVPEPAARPTGPVPITEVTDLPYTSGQELDVFHPRDGGPWPVVVYFHGGEELREHSRPFARQVAERGTVVVLPQYRATPAELELDLDGALQDAACAMRFARARAVEYGGAPSRVVAAGFSFGGTMAAVMAVSSGEDFTDDCIVASDLSARADGLVGIDAVYDMATPLVADGATAAEATVYDGFAYLDEQGFDARPSVPTVILTGIAVELNDQGERFRDALTARGWDVAYARTQHPHSLVRFDRLGEASEAVAAVAYDEPVVLPSSDSS